MLPLLLSSEQLLATDQESTDTTTHTGTATHTQTATDYNSSGAGAGVTNHLSSQTRPLGSGDADGSSDLILNVSRDEAGDYVIASASISASINANAKCSPCGASIDLYDYGTGDEATFINYAGDSHNFIGKVNVSDGGDGFLDVGATLNANLEAAATNATGIATNKTNIATNTTNIATNKIDIAANTSLIATNTATLSALIGINGVGIQSLASSFSSFQEDTNRNFIALTGNMYEGLAEVTAISNVAYASSGWRASAGYGDYKSKSATAVGISYAGEKYKFKFSKSGDATGFGISYDF